jgi:hypothetical protein
LRRKIDIAKTGVITDFLMKYLDKPLKDTSTTCQEAAAPGGGSPHSYRFVGAGLLIMVCLYRDHELRAKKLAMSGSKGIL